MGAFWITSIAFLTTGMILTIVAAETQSQDVILLAIAFTFVAAVCALIASRRDRSKIDVTCMECGARKHIDPMNRLPWCECETKRDPWPAVPYRDAFEERMIENWADREILEELLRRNEIVPREAPMENGRIGLWLDDYKHPKYEGHSDIRLVFDENGSLVSFGAGP